MTDDNVRPIRADLSDEALFAGAALEPAPAPAETTTHAVTTAIRIMRAANLKLTFGFDQDDAERLWASKLSGFSSAAIIQASSVWIDSGAEDFPTLSEFETVVKSAQATLDHPPVPQREPGSECPECFATDDEPTAGFALAEKDAGGTRTVRPCSVCNPQRYEAWRHGFPRKAKK